MRMMNPFEIVFPSGKVPEKGSRLDLVVLELAVAEIVFCRLLDLGFLEYLGIL